MTAEVPACGAISWLPEGSSAQPPGEDPSIHSDWTSLPWLNMAQLFVVEAMRICSATILRNLWHAN